MLTLLEEDAAHLAAGGTLVVRTAGAARAVRLAIAAERLAAGTAVWRTPDVVTVEHWLRRECERGAQTLPDAWPRVLTPAEEWLWWREAALEAASEHPLLDPGALGAALRRADARAAEYGLAPVPGAADSEVRLLHRAGMRFRERCRAAHAASVAGLLARLGESPAEGLLRLRGFDAVPPRLAALTGAAADAAAHAPAMPAAVRAIRVADSTAEIEAIAAWCCARLEAQPDARLRVILPGPPGLRERLAALIRSSLDPAGALAGSEAARASVALEGSAPLAAGALTAHALVGLDVLAGRRIPVEVLARWLRAPWWREPAAGVLAALAQRLRAMRVPSFDLQSLAAALREIADSADPVLQSFGATLRAAARPLGAGPATAQEWVDRFDDALRQLGSPDAAGEELHLLRMRRRWGELLEAFGSLEASLGTLRSGQALDLLASLAQHETEPTGEDDAAVTLSATLTDPVAVYDGIWVGGLTADVLPMPVSPDPYLPLAAQVACGIPEASIPARRAQAQSLLRAWQRSSRETVLSVPAHEADRELLPSALVAGLVPAEPAHRSAWLPVRLRREGQVQVMVDVRGAAFDAARRLPRGTETLTLQNRCPFRAYAELRLGAVRPQEPEPGVPADLRGRILHGALQRLWERLRDSAALAACDAGALAALIGECVRAAALEAAPARPRGAEGGLTPSLERECGRTRALIVRLCELERSRGDFAVEAIEQPLELELGGARLRLRVDRVDRVPAGRVILDYKSGASGHADWLGARPTHPQLLAYLAALGDDVVALATVHVTAREMRLKGIAADAGVLPRVKGLPEAAGSWAQQCAAWRLLLERLIASFLAGEAAVDPLRGACSHCHLHALCRVDELGLELAAETDEEEAGD